MRQGRVRQGFGTALWLACAAAAVACGDNTNGGIGAGGNPTTGGDNVQCQAGLTDCAGTCVDTTGDVANCGSCGAVCMPPHASGACTSGSCGVGTCAPGYGDCNGLISDGCETNTRYNPLHCGICRHACSSGMICLDGVCRRTPREPSGGSDGGTGSDGSTGTDGGGINPGGGDGGMIGGGSDGGTNTGGGSDAGTNTGGDGDMWVMSSGPDGGTNTGGGSDGGMTGGGSDGGTNTGGGSDGSTTGGGGSDGGTGGTGADMCTSGTGSDGGTIGGGGGGSDGGTSGGGSDGGTSSGGGGDMCSAGSDGGVTGGGGSDGGTAADMSLVCPSGQIDCNGVCVDESNNPNNCGGCGFACSRKNGSPLCTKGKCLIHCNWGWGNCDANATTGCESDLLTDPNNCGACAIQCSPGQSCINGICI